MKKSMKFGLITSLSALVVGLSMPAYALLLDGDMQPLTAYAETENETVSTDTFVMENGASVRKKDPTGIRFSTYVNETYYDNLEKDKTENGTSYHFGTLVIPESILGENVLTENISKALDIKANVWGESKVDGYKIYHAVLTDIPSTDFDTVLVARSYVCINGVYNFVETSLERSIAQVASIALSVGESDENGVLLNYVDTVAESVSVDKADALMKTGTNTTLVATASPSGYAITWETSNKEVATVKDGVVTAVSAGEATITAKFGKKTATCIVTVKDTVKESYQLQDVGAVSVNEYGELTWDEVSTADGEVTADGYEVTITGENGTNVYSVSTNAYQPYALANGTYTATVKATNIHSWVSNSVNSSAEYKFVVTRHVDYSAESMLSAFTTAESNTKVEYADGYAIVKNDGNDYGLIGMTTPITLNMASNPILVMDVVDSAKTAYVKMSYDGSSNASKNDNGKVYMLKDTALEEGYFAIRANTPLESEALTTSTNGVKFYLGVSNGSDAYLTLRGVYIVSIMEYVNTLEQLSAPENIVINGSVLSANKVSAPRSEITYTLEITGDSYSERFSGLESPEVDLTSLSLTSGVSYNVYITANGDGEYYSDSETVATQIFYNEVYSETVFSGNSLVRRDGGAGGKVEDGKLVFEKSGGNYGLFAYAIDMTGKRLTVDSVIEITFGEVTDDTKFWTGFFKNSGNADNDKKFEDIVKTGETLVVKDFYNGSYIIDNVLYLGVGIGGHGGDGKKIVINEIKIAEYSFYPCEAMITSEALSFDKSNETAQTVAYTFQNGGTLAFVSIDGNKINDYSDENNVVTINTGAISGLSYGKHIVTVTDSNGYSASVELTVTNSQAVSFESGYVNWFADENATAYQVEIVDSANNVKYTETVSGTTYPVADKNLPTDVYTVRVTSVYADETTSAWGSVKLNIEQLMYRSGKLYNSSYKYGESDKTEEKALAVYDEEKGVTRITTNNKDWGCVFTDDFKVAYSDNSYLSITFGEVTKSYYVRLMQEGNEKWSSGDTYNNDTRIVSLKDRVNKGSETNCYIKMGSANQNGGYAEFKSLCVCNITVVK